MINIQYHTHYTIMTVLHTPYEISNAFNTYFPKLHLNLAPNFLDLKTHAFLISKVISLIL